MTADQLSDEQLAEIERDLAVSKPEQCDCSWKEPHTNFDCDYEDRLWNWIGARDRIAAGMPSLLRALRDARDEARNHELCNGGCVPGDAYRDLAHHHAEAERENAALRERLAAVEQLCVMAESQLVANGYLLAVDVRSALAAPTGQPDQSQVHNPSIPAADPVAFLAHRHGLAHTDCWCAHCEGAAKHRLLDAGEIDLVTAACGFMHLCPDCGNKRCPRAAWHGNDCTGSNEPGQPGSDYPSSPSLPAEQEQQQ